MKYIDSKADQTFKKIFGEHPDLLISLLNAQKAPVLLLGKSNKMLQSGIDCETVKAWTGLIEQETQSFM